MSTSIAIGFSSAADPALALREASIDAKNKSGQPKCDLAVVLATPSHAAIPLDSLHKILQPEKLIGAVAPAIILSDTIETSGVAVLSLTSADILTGIAAQNTLSLLPLQEAGLRFARDLASRMTDTQRHGALLFIDGVTLNHSLFIRGLQEGLGRAFAITGGISSGGVFCQDQLIRNAVGGIIFGGQTAFASACRHGWQPLGRPRIIDEAEGNTIRVISGKPAVSIYQEYFPDEAERLANGDLSNIGLLYPLGFNTTRPREYLIKNPSAILPDGSIVCQGETPRGTPLHLMIADKDACRKAVRDASLDARDQLHGKHPRLIMPFLSIARRKLFGRAAWQEIAAIKEILGVACPVLGMYTYGEIGSAAQTRNSLDTQVHNASVIVTAIG